MTAPAEAHRTCVLVAAEGAGWEPAALQALERAGIVVLKRCVDLADLLGTAASGQAQAAVVAAAATGLDHDVLSRLRAAGVHPIAVAGDAPPAALARMDRLAVPVVEDTGELAARIEQLLATGGVGSASPPEPLGEVPGPQPGRVGRCVAVWGPAGAPGRTLLATGLAAVRAERGASVVLVDADPHGGAVAQHLGVLDEVSGLLTAARLVNDGGFDGTCLHRCSREVRPGLAAVTGLPRADRWPEVHEGVLSTLVDVAGRAGDVVLDTGFSLEDLGGRPGRNAMTLEALAAADEVVVVGSAEPSGLTRLTRGLLELAALVPGTPSRVVINRMRSTLGWRESDLVGMVEGYAGVLPVHFLPEDREPVDRALVLGRSVTETAEGPLVEGVRQVADAAFGAAPGGHRADGRDGRGGWLRRRARAQVPKSR